MEVVNLPPHRDEIWLKQAYKYQDMTITEIAEACGVSEDTVKKWLHRFDLIEVQDLHLSREAQVSDEYTQEWRNKQKWKSTREKAIRDAGRECEECGIGGDEHTQRYGHGLHAHHIEQASEGGDKYNLENLKVLCKECHEKKH